MEELCQHRQGLYNAGGGAFGYEINPILYGGNDVQKKKYLMPWVRGEIRGCFAISEPSGGSDPARAIRTRAVKTPQGWVLNGSKTWISHAKQADFVTVFVRTDDGPSGTRGEITCFIVETGSPGYRISEPIRVIRPEAPHELVFEDCVVPEEQMLGQRGQGFELLKTLLTQNRIPYSAQCVGIAKKSLEMASEYAQIRETFGKLLSERQAIQWMLADSAVEIHAARLVTYNAARCRAQDKPFQLESSMAKLMATEMAMRVVDRCIQIHGGMGLAQELPLERWYRELRTRRIGEGPSEVHRMVIARTLT
jgi:acyl-CoA dehydrogenase